MLLQKVNKESDKAGSGNLLKAVFYVLSLVVAFLFGGYHEHSKHPSAADSPTETVAAAPTPATPADEAANVPLAAVPSATPEVAVAPASSPVRVEKGVAVATAVTPSSAPAPAVAPAKQANQVTITEPVEIPVKNDAGKITGYINLQKGQMVTPLDIENDQIRIKSGNTFVMVPLKSTDMAH